MFVDVAAAFDVPELLEDAVLIRQAPGRYDNDGIWVSGKSDSSSTSRLWPRRWGRARIGKLLPEGIQGARRAANFGFSKKLEALIPGES